MKYRIFDPKGVLIEEVHNPFEAQEICECYGDGYYYEEVQPRYASVY